MKSPMSKEMLRRLRVQKIFVSWLLQCRSFEIATKSYLPPDSKDKWRISRIDDAVSLDKIS